MTVRRLLRASSGPIRVDAGVVSIRTARLGDGRRWSQARIAHEADIRRLEATVSDDWARANASTVWTRGWLKLRREIAIGQRLSMVVDLDGTLVGQFEVAGIVRGALQSARASGWVARTAAEGGVAHAAAAMGLDFCFGPLGLHRIDAAIRSDCQPALRVLADLGLREEARLQRYANVDGQWRDHILFAVTAGELPGTFVQRLVDGGAARY